MNLHRANRSSTIILLLLAACLQATNTQGQLHTGSSFHIRAGTVLVIDSLVLQPTDDLDLSGRAITVDYAAVPALLPLGAASIERVYTINPLIDFKGNLGLYYDDAELNGNDPTQLQLQYNDGTTFSANTLVTLDNTGNYVSGTTGVGLIPISKITSVEGGVVLPLQLLSFIAAADGERARLDWITVAEQGVDRFDIERSANGKDFSFLFQEAAKGVDQEEHTYTRYDEQPLRGWNYYRLRILDVDGHDAYSTVAAVHFGPGGDAKVTVYPNPSSGKLYLHVLAAEPAAPWCAITDMSGRQVWQTQLGLEQGENLFVIDISQLASGAYLLQLGDRYKVKVIRQ